MNSSTASEPLIIYQFRSFLVLFAQSQLGSMLHHVTSYINYEVSPRDLGNVHKYTLCSPYSAQTSLLFPASSHAGAPHYFTPKLFYAGRSPPDWNKERAEMLDFDLFKIPNITFESSESKTEQSI
ncbi:uncharacterized protein PRCAT00006331001 [Priceomyces carsonii]|uniref:uncharacterized protein n=1 Tax=Priceomyces carsonii TaxID=28549 RepID=UPI002ED99FC7|nr:unnamed protein product [Priceomyces carsonii]